MPDAQLPLFKRKTFPAPLSSIPMEIIPPGPENTVVGTLPAYFAYLQSGGYSTYTPRQCLSDVNSFGLFVREKILKTDGLKLRQQPYTAKTINRKLSAINNYFLWLVTQGALADNPAAGLHVPKVISPLPDILFESECQQLLATANADPRSDLLVLLLLETGIKKEELFALRLTHFDFSNRYAL